MALNGHFTSVVLAGGPPDAIAALHPGAPNKAFVPIGGSALVTRTIAALRSSPNVGRIVAVIPAEAADDAAVRGADATVPAGATMTLSLQSGLRGLPADDLVLVTAADLPILSSAAIDDVLARAVASDADLTYACVERSVHLARFPEVPHTWATLRDGTFCGGGCVVMRPRVLPRLTALLDGLGRARKNPVRLAAIFGIDILLRYALRALPIERIERRASELLGAPVRAAISPHAEIAVNVDRVADVAVAERLVNNPA